MTLQPGLMLACMLGIGFLAQWLAWRLKLPAILFLLLAGCSGRTKCLAACCFRWFRWRWR